MKVLNNKKGFTLVELLAVIVILALIMSIAIVSMTGIMQGARESTFKDTAVQIINGVRNQLTLSMETVTMAKSKYDGNGQVYYFEKSIIEKGGSTSPLGGEIQYLQSTSGMTKIGSMGVWRAADGNVTCNPANPSFVRVRNGSTGNLEYSICLTAGANNRYIIDRVVSGSDTIYVGSEANLLGNSTEMIKP